MAPEKTEGTQSQPEVEFRFSRSPGYRVHPADGAWGGLTPAGEVMVCFYIDHLPVPEKLRQAVSEEGRLGQEVFRDPPKDAGIITRELQTGIVMSLDRADTLAKWLIDKVKRGREIEGGD